MSEDREFFRIKFSALVDLINVIVLSKKNITYDIGNSLDEYIRSFCDSKLKIYTLEDKKMIINCVFKCKSLEKSIIEENNKIINNIFCNHILRH